MKYILFMGNEKIFLVNDWCHDLFLGFLTKPSCTYWRHLEPGKFRPFGGLFLIPFHCYFCVFISAALGS